METCDDEFVAAAKHFVTRQHEAGKPFFCWVNTTHMHLRTHTKPESIGQAGRWQSTYHDTMVDHDKNVGELLDLLDRLGIADETFVMYSTDNGAREHLARRCDDAVPQREEYQLGRRLPGAATRALAGQDPGGRRDQRDRAASRLAADFSRDGG
jgi:arylsulfatase A-like enzyme